MPGGQTRRAAIHTTCHPDGCPGQDRDPPPGERPARGWDALAAPLFRMDDGLILASEGRILAVEPYAAYRRRPDALPAKAILDLGDVALAPGLVNCHTHLELSWMHGKTAAGQGFLPWLDSLISLDRHTPETALAHIRTALETMRTSGTCLVGDISSRVPDAIIAAAREAMVEVRPFLEIIGHTPETVDLLAATANTNPLFSLAGHALYTTPGESFVKAKAWCNARTLPFSMHLAEHDDETEFLLTGKGPFGDRLRETLVPETWTAPMMRPVPFAESLGLLTPGTVAVHCVTCDSDDIETLSRSGCAVCLCPRSNRLIGVGEAPARSFAEKGVLLVLGTDSLASNHDLSLWQEAEYFLQKNLFPANALLRMATVNGAAALGLSHHFGTLESCLYFCYTVFPSGTFA